MRDKYEKRKFIPKKVKSSGTTSRGPSAGVGDDFNPFGIGGGKSVSTSFDPFGGRDDVVYESESDSVASPVHTAPSNATSPSKGAEWPCSKCTFLNHALLLECEICGTPKKIEGAGVGTPNVSVGTLGGTKSSVSKDKGTTTTKALSPPPSSSVNVVKDAVFDPFAMMDSISTPTKIVPSSDFDPFTPPSTRGPGVQPPPITANMKVNHHPTTTFDPFGTTSSMGTGVGTVGHNGAPLPPTYLPTTFGPPDGGGYMYNNMMPPPHAHGGTSNGVYSPYPPHSAPLYGGGAGGAGGGTGMVYHPPNSLYVPNPTPPGNNTNPFYTSVGVPFSSTVGGTGIGGGSIPPYGMQYQPVAPSPDVYMVPPPTVPKVNNGGASTNPFLSTVEAFSPKAPPPNPYMYHNPSNVMVPPPHHHPTTPTNMPFDPFNNKVGGGGGGGMPYHGGVPPPPPPPPPKDKPSDVRKAGSVEGALAAALSDLQLTGVNILWEDLTVKETIGVGGFAEVFLGIYK